MLLSGKARTFVVVTVPVVSQRMQMSMRLRFFFFFSSRRRHTRSDRDWSSDVCSSDLGDPPAEHRALRDTVGVLDLSFRSRLCLTGADRQKFLNGQATNNVKDLKVGEIGRASCRESVDLGGRRIIKKKKKKNHTSGRVV